MPDPEALARIEIDRLLTEAGWIVVDRDQANNFAGRGIAIREVSIPGAGEADYLLIADKRAIGIIEAKEFGKGNDFCQKTTYWMTGIKPEDLLAQFRNNSYSRIVVTVDMIATRIDVKPIQSFLFMHSLTNRVFVDPLVEYRG